MKKEALEKLIEKYELQRNVVTELIQKSEPEEDSSTQLAVRRFLSAIIYDLKACVGQPDSDTSGGLHKHFVSNNKVAVCDECGYPEIVKDNTYCCTNPDCICFVEQTDC